jgi:hypothetical protein
MAAVRVFFTLRFDLTYVMKHLDWACDVWYDDTE